MNMEEWQAREDERAAKIAEMFKVADDLGEYLSKDEIGQRMRFDTWQEALDFQALCAEKGIRVKVIEPSSSGHQTYDDQFHFVVPE